MSIFRYALDTEQYIREHESLVSKQLHVHYQSERLIEKYKEVLTPEEYTKAYLMIWNAESEEDYQRKFLYGVLEGYHIWEISNEMAAKDLERRYEFIVANNPNWAKHFSNDFANKKKRCKVKLPYDEKGVEMFPEKEIVAA